MKVLVTAPWPARQLVELRAAFPMVELAPAKTEEDAIAGVTDADGVFGHLSRDAYLSARRLRWIQSHGAGVEWMMHIPELIASDVIVTNTRGAHAATIAEHTFGILICLARGFYSLFEAQQRRVWLRPLLQPAVGLSGLTLGIVGLGAIGRAVAQRGHAFDMRVIAVDAHDVPQPDFVSDLFRLVDLPEFLRQADVVVVTVPLTEATRGMIGVDQLALMKQSAYLIAVSRGGIIDERALVGALREGRLAGAGLDVQEQKPLPPVSELWDAPNVIITPHCSGESWQTTATATAMFRDNLAKFVAGEPLMNVVNKNLGY